MGATTTEECAMSIEASTADHPAAAAGTVTIGGDLVVNRMGFGAMRLAGGQWSWGPPDDEAKARSVLRTALDLGVTFIDTADAYGPFVVEDLIASELSPYPSGLVIATKGGQTRSGWDKWEPLGRPEYLRQCVAMSLRRLRVERIDLYQLHRIDPQVPLADQIGALKEMQDAGLIRHLGLSEVTVEELIEASAIAPIASVQNLYNLGNRIHEPVLDHCTREGIAFIPWFPMAMGKLAGHTSPLADAAAARGATPAQIALAWLLRRSPMMLPIPGTTSPDHLAENCEAARIVLTDEEYDAIAAMVPDKPRTGKGAAAREVSDRRT
jgi:aryl-alcohol dehydrogenase-like predicted oxidoreductase